MNQFHNIVSAICRPNPNAFPDPEQRKYLFNKNKVSFYFIGGTILFRMISMLFASFDPSFDLLQFLTIPSLMVLHVFLCRSYLRFYHILMSICCPAWCIWGLIYLPGTTPYFWGLTYVTPLFMYLVTQSLVFMCLTAAYQTIGIYYYKINFLKIMRSSDGEIVDFVDKFVEYAVVVLIFIIGCYGLLLNEMRKKNVELSKAIKIAEEANEQQKTFLYSFSHELRNPINSLLGNLQLILMNNITHEIREMVMTSKICSELLLNIINTVLDAGKLDIGKLEVNYTRTRIHDLLQRIWTVSNELIVRKNLKSHLKIDKKVPPILMIDGHRINQILMNLLGNAVKFTQKGGISITVKWLETEKVTDKSFEPIPYDSIDEGVFEKEENMYLVKTTNQGKEHQDHFVLTKGVKEFNLSGVEQTQFESKGVLKIIIKDTGCGMTQQDVNKLFKKFSQVGSDNLKKQMGTGLGLFISQQICKNMGGDVRAFSKPGIGSTFIVCIPTVAIPSRYRMGIDTNMKTIIKKISEKKLRTLVADDSPFNVNLVSDFCSKIGIEVVSTAENGQIALNRYLESIREGDPLDLITLDIDMPVMSGKTACEKIREYERANGLKPVMIILISGNYEEQAIITVDGQQQKAQAECFLRKPLLFEELCWAIYKQIFPLELHSSRELL